MSELVIASVSGGKDSTAMCLWLKEQEIDFIPVHMDTMWEHPITDEYIRDTLEKTIGPIRWIVPELGMADLIRKKGMFPGRVCRFCTQMLKVFPFYEFAEQYPAPINAVGIRRAESKARSKLPERELVEGWLEVWRPLLDWTEEDVIAIHTRHGIKPNPLYLKGAERVGCWPCIFSRKEEIRRVADWTPWRIDEIRALEEEVQELARKRYEAKGETFESQGYAMPTFFTDKDRTKMIPIDQAVSWSRTSHGGKQFSLVLDDRSGCMRWGLCDA